MPILPRDVAQRQALGRGIAEASRGELPAATSVGDRRDKWQVSLSLRWTSALSRLLLLCVVTPWFQQRLLPSIAVHAAEGNLPAILTAVIGSAPVSKQAV